jgi:hypothetical protein
MIKSGPLPTTFMILLGFFESMKAISTLEIDAIPEIGFWSIFAGNACSLILHSPGSLFFAQDFRQRA